MLTVKKAMTIMLENDANKRNEMIDKLTEEDAKYLLKQCLAIMQERNVGKEVVNK